MGTGLFFAIAIVSPYWSLWLDFVILVKTVKGVSGGEWVGLNLDYIAHWSLWLDSKILLKTLPGVLSKKGTY